MWRKFSIGISFGISKLVSSKLHISMQNLFWGYLKYQLKYLFVNSWNQGRYWLKIFKMVVWSFWFGLNTFSPFGINRQKWRLLEPFVIFSPIGTSKYEWRIIPIESDVEWRRRVNSTDRVEWKPCPRRRLHFPFNIRLSIGIYLKTH